MSPSLLGSEIGGPLSSLISVLIMFWLFFFLIVVSPKYVSKHGMLFPIFELHSEGTELWMFFSDLPLSLSTILVRLTHTECSRSFSVCVPENPLTRVHHNSSVLLQTAHTSSHLGLRPGTPLESFLYVPFPVHVLESRVCACARARTCTRRGHVLR